MSATAQPHQPPRRRRAHNGRSGPHPTPPDNVREPATALTSLVKEAIASRAKTRHLIMLLVAVAGVLLVLLAFVIAAAVVLGPIAAAVAGGVSVSSAAASAAVRAWRRHRS